MPFSSLGLAPALAQAAAGLGFGAPTPIQTEAIPAVLGGRDLLASTRTGSGKTAAYALRLLQRWSESAGTGTRRTRALVLVPIRELAAQVGEVLPRWRRRCPGARSWSSPSAASRSTRS